MNESDICYIKRKGGTVLLNDGRQYYKHNTYKNNTELWVCANKKKYKCKGSLTTNEDKIIKSVRHSCQQDFSKNEMDVIIYDELKTIVENSDRPITALYEEKITEDLQDKGNEVVKLMPKFENIQHGMYNIRNRKLGVRKLICSKPEEVEVPNNFKDFVLADYEYEGTRILIFCSQAARQHLVNLKEEFGDATFASCPVPFTQLYSIHGEVSSTADTVNVVLLIYALLCDKKEKTYETMFELIKSQIPSWNPTTFHCDFEVGAINALLSVFPNIKIKGCYYHWARKIWRKGKYLGHTKCKQERRILGLCTTLALLAQEKIKTGFEYIESECDDIIDMPKFLKYMRKIINKNKYFDIISAFGERHRTNNVVEAWHSKINRSINKNSNNILRLLNVLKLNSNLAEIKIDKLKSNRGKSTRRRKEYILSDDVIRNTQLQLINGEITVGHALEKLR